MKNDLDHFIPLMKKKGVTISKEDFHQSVNKIFHDVESKYYDALHHAMDTSLQQQFDLLGGDIKKILPPNIAKEKVMLDVGCGTGLSADKFLKSEIGQYVSKIYLLDTSKGMLEQCEAKAKKWNIDYHLIEGDIFSLSPDIKFDIILTCSVLHHIPNLTVFLNQISSLQNKDGFFIHLQDPNGDYVFSPEYINRKAKLRSHLRKEKIKNNFTGILFNKIRTIIYKIIGIKNKDYIFEVNDALMKAGIVKIPLTDREIWSITDLHVDDLDTSYGKGISLKFLQNELHDYALIKMRSYGFFGTLKMNLPESFQQMEDSYIKDNLLNGRELSAVWQHN